MFAADCHDVVKHDCRASEKAEQDAKEQDYRR